MRVGDFNTLITRALRGNQFANVPVIMQEMQGRRILPKVTTFIAMIGVNIKMSKLTEAKEVFRATEQANIQPEVIAYSAMITGALSHSTVQESIEILKNIINGEILPNRNSLLSADGRHGPNQEDSGRHAAIQINPEALTYSVMISEYPQNGDLRYAMEWYYKMLDGGFKPARFMMNNLMSALHGSEQGMQILVL
ncbi:hypothetical protein EC957_007546 [Mortierella hygrophila]|uniref:Pentatricopeptide repeat-containing protein n=1 Tax=Mortierella hygrophila TaxID=979708 RepID=A0A9P6EYC4_9FUNG|nr:hypothetical protein EC957_007546 [Mortierella hygrophila]